MREAAGYAVDVAQDGGRGLELAREEDYDAIVLDIMLPVHNGYVVCEKLRAAGNWTQILMLTAKDGEWDEAEALDTSADDFLSKAFSYVVLLARLRALLRRGSGERPAVLQVGKVRLDPASHRCWVGEVEVDLARLGLRLRGRCQHRGGLHRPSSRQDRPPLRPAGRADRPRHRLPDRRPTWVIRMTERRFRPPSRWSVRARTTAVATGVVALTLLVGVVGLVLTVRAQLTTAAEESASVRADDIESLIEGGASLEAIAASDEDDALLQALDASGDVVTSSANIAGSAPMLGASGIRDTPVGEHAFVIVTHTVDTPEGTLRVISGQSLERVEEITSLLLGLLGGGLPVVLLIVAGTLWRMTGASPTPVEDIRRRVDQVQAADPRQRVPVPDTDDEIARLARTMNTMLERVETFQRHQRQFISYASHELRSPIAILRQLTEVALAHSETDVPALLDDVHTETIRMQALVDDLLLLARGQHADPHGQARPWTWTISRSPRSPASAEPPH